MKKGNTFVGLAVHKETIVVAIADEGGGAARSLGTIPNRPEAVLRLVRKLGPTQGLQVCYEAGPCGYGLQRQLARLGADCLVVAPSLVPTRPGDRVKTDRRDALKLAGLLRSGHLTPVWVPDEEHEALRDLVRAREDARQDLLRARHRLGKLLLRLGVRPPEGIRPWTAKHRLWLQGLRLPHASQQVVLPEYLLAVDQGKERLSRLEAELAQAEAEVQRQIRETAAARLLVTAHGIGPISALTILAEIGDINRFPTPEHLVSYTGLAPRVRSSGGRTRLGHITKQGPSALRWVLIEATHFAVRKPGRLQEKYRRLRRGKSSAVAITACARELLIAIYWMLKRGEAFRADGSPRMPLTRHHVPARTNR